MNKWKISSNTSGVSEVIGTILLLSISVTLFSVVYITVLSFPGAPSTPSSNIAMSLNETSLTLTHVGGQSLGLDSKIQIMVDDTIHSYDVSARLNATEKQDNYWGFGEQFELNFSEIGITPAMIEYTLGVTVIDVDSNSVVMSGNKVITNKPPIIGSPFPYDTSIKVSVDISQLRITISDPDNDAFEWSIESYPDIGHNSGSMQVYTTKEFSCSVTTKLNINALYIWFVNATDINGKSTNKTYTFWTSISGDYKDAVDSNISDVDLSPDKGIEMNFANAQMNTTDASVMTIQESDYGNQDYNTAVQGNAMDMDSSPDLGTETNFINCKETARDADNMSLVESLTGLAAVNEYDYVDSFTGTSTGWTTSGATPYIAAVGGGYITTSTDGAIERWFTFTNTASTGDSLVVALEVYVTAGDGNDDITVNIDTNGDNTAEYTKTITNPTSGWYTTGTIGGLTTQAAVNSARASFTHTKSANANTITIDCARLYVTRTSTITYRLDLEYNWSTTHFSEHTEQICFFVQRHTGGTENLAVKYWTGSGWGWLGNITTVGWTNLTAVGLTSGTYIIRLHGNTETNDIVEDSWDIDCIFLHTYNSSIYKIDFEYQWTHANYSDAHKQVCMYIASRTGTEPLNINYRNGAVWTTIGTITGTGWVNVTATGLSTSTYTIQLIGTSETSDVEIGSWNIDCLYLHTWT